MLRLDRVIKPWKESAALNDHINLYGFWNETAFLTKSGDLGMVLSVPGVDYESLDHSEQEYAVKRLEAALKAFGPGFHVYQYLFKSNRPDIPFATYDDPIVEAAIDQRRKFFEAKRDHLCQVEIFYCIVLEGSRSKTGVATALARLLRDPEGGIAELKSQFTNDSMKKLLRTHIECDLQRLDQQVQAFARQLMDFMQAQILNQQQQFSFFRRLLNYDDWRVAGRPQSTQFLDYQVVNSDIEAERDHLRVGDHTRDKRRAVELTDAGRVFVKEARSALFHIERAGHLAHAAHQGAVNVLMIGLSPCVEQDWISGLLTIHLPLYQRIRIRWRSQFPVDLVRSVLAGELDLALVAAPPEDSQITSVLLSRAQLYAIVPEGHAAAQKESLVLEDLAQDAWILFSKQVHPLLRSAIIEAAQREEIVPKDVHDILTAQPLRTAAELDAFTGLRRGELIGLRWEDVDFENLVIHVRRSVVMMVQGAPKTEASAKDVPLDAALAESLLKLRLVGPYNRETDWVFASPTMKGKQPLWPETLWRRYGRPAVKAAKIEKRVGFHTFRHTYTTLLTQNSEEVKVVQELLRHANSRITLDLYAQAGMPNKRLAQSKLVRMVLNKGEALA